MKKVLLALLPLYFLLFSFPPSLRAGQFYSTHSAGEKSVVVLSAPAQVSVQFEVLNFSSTADIEVMCFDAATLPANTTVPYISFPLGKGTATLPGVANPHSYPSVQFTKGMVCGCSTTPTALTIDTSNDCFFQISTQ